MYRGVTSPVFTSVVYSWAVVQQVWKVWVMFNCWKSCQYLMLLNDIRQCGLFFRAE